MPDPRLIDVSQVPLAAIASFRERYRREMDCQIVHDSWHERGFTTSYLISIDGEAVGHGAVGGAPGDSKDTLKEFYLLPPHRGHADIVFSQLVRITGANRIEAQTNDALLFLMLLDSATELSTDRVLFADSLETDLAPPDATFRKIEKTDRRQIFGHQSEPVGDYVIECGGVIAATGGLMLHYNPPFADLYMEVAEPYRRRGFGSFLIQELKRICYQRGLKPAARCDSSNLPSRRTLQRAGMFPCGRIVQGRLAT